MMLTNVQWHPDGKALAIDDTGQNRIAFFLFTGGRAPRLKPWGNSVETGRDPFVGRFIRDGRFYLISEWGRDFAAKDLDGPIPTSPGTLGITRLADDGEHRRIGAAKVGNSHEGPAIIHDRLNDRATTARSVQWMGTRGIRHSDESADFLSLFRAIAPRRGTSLQPFS